MECLNKMISKSRMRQGESFPLRFNIYTKADKATQTPSMPIVGVRVSPQTEENSIIPSNVAITVGTMKKLWEHKATAPRADEIWYNAQQQCWNFPISQAESLEMAPGEYKGLIKVLFNGDPITGGQDALSCEIESLLMIESIDKTILNSGSGE